MREHQALHLRRGAVAHRGQVGDEADDPEHDRHGGVGRHGEHVPDERAAELGPQPHRVRVGEQPVGRQPGTPRVEQREERRAGHGEDRHGFGEPADRHAPLLLEEQQNRRDQRARVADADPPHEVDDVERPADWNVVAPDEDALVEQHPDGQLQHREQGEPDQEPDHPAEGGALGERDLGNGLGDRLVVLAAPDNRGLQGGARRLCVDVLGHLSARSRSSSRRATRCARPRSDSRAAPGSDCARQPGRWCAAAC